MKVMYGLCQRLVPKTNLHLGPKVQEVILGSSKLNVLAPRFRLKTKVSHFWAVAGQGIKSMGIVGKFGGRHSYIGKLLKNDFVKLKIS